MYCSLPLDILCDDAESVQVASSKETRSVIIQKLTTLLQKSLQIHDNSRMWFYHINYVKDSPCNLSSYLGLEENEYIAVMHGLNLMKKTASGNHISGNKWDLLLNGCNMNTCRLHITQVSSEDGIPKKRLKWIGLGEYREGEEKYDVPKQFKVWNDQKEEAKQRSSSRTTRRMAAEVKEESIGPKTIESLWGSDSNCEMNVSSTFKTFVNWLDGIDDDIDDDDEEGNDSNRAAAAETPTAACPDQWGYNINNEQILDNVNLDQFPILKKLGMPLRPSLLKALQGELVNLSRQCEDEFPMGYQSSNGTFRPFYIIPRVKNNKSFNRYAGPVIDLLVNSLVSHDHADTIVQNLTPVDANDDELAGVQDATVKELTSWIKFRVITRIAGDEKDIIRRVGKHFGMSMNDGKMDEPTTLAMIHEANISSAAFRVINRYLSNTFGRRLMASEKKMTSIIEDNIKPQIQVTVLDEDPSYGTR